MLGLGSELDVFGGERAGFEEFSTELCAGLPSWNIGKTFSSAGFEPTRSRIETPPSVFLQHNRRQIITPDRYQQDGPHSSLTRRENEEPLENRDSACLSFCVPQVALGFKKCTVRGDTLVEYNESLEVLKV